MKRFFKNKNGSLYFFDDSYTDNELNIRICNIPHCDSTMITKKALFNFAEKLKLKEPLIETDDSNYESQSYFSAELQEKGYLFKLRGSVSMYIELTFKQVDKLIDYLFSNCG
jgi:hypothetical protein